MTGWSPLESLGDATLVRTRESVLATLSSALHERYQRCGGFTAHFGLEDARKTLYAPLRGPVFPLVTYTIDNPVTVNAISANVVPANICSTITTLSNFHTRYYKTQTGFDAAAWIKQRWEQITAGRSDVLVSYFDHPNFLQHSVVLRIVGSQTPHEAVVLGAHLDSIRSSQPSDCNVQPPPSSCRAPGADDDASGIASITETLRAAMAVGYKPARTVFFIGYAGEEAGLLGSKDIALWMNPAVKQTKSAPVGALQLDMTNFKSTAAGAVDVGILNDVSFTNGPQNQFIADLLTAYQPGTDGGDQHLLRLRLLGPRLLDHAGRRARLDRVRGTLRAAQLEPAHGQRHARVDGHDLQPRREVQPDRGGLHGRAGEGRAAPPRWRALASSGRRLPG